MSQQKNYLNSYGLVNGIIPAGEVCSFTEECIIYDKERCPNKDNLMEGGYSCACARGFSMANTSVNYTCACEKTKD